MAPYWFPVVTLVLGAAGGYLADALRDSRAAAREQAAVQRAREREADAFQRETLVELQDWVAKLGRAASVNHQHDEREYRLAGTWASTLVDEEWSDREHQAIVHLQRLRVRVADDAVRARVGAFVSLCTAVGVPAGANGHHERAREEANVSMRQAAETMGELNELIGERLRELA